MDDTISRQAAIDALCKMRCGCVLSDCPLNYEEDGTEECADVRCLMDLPSAQPEQSFEIQNIIEYLDTVLHPIVSPDHWNVYSELHDMISMLPPAQQRVRCKDCKHRPRKEDPNGDDYGFNLDYPDNESHRCPCIISDGWYSWMPDDNWFCGNGERRGKMSDLIDRQEALSALSADLDKIPMVNNSANDMIRRDERIICINTIKALSSAQQWIPVTERLPNEDEIIYNGVGINGERKVSDRVCAIDSDGFIRCGYFQKSCMEHEYCGNGRKNEYSETGIASWEFGDHWDCDPNQWIVTVSTSIVAWMPLPSPYKEDSE